MEKLSTFREILAIYISPLLQESVFFETFLVGSLRRVRIHYAGLSPICHSRRYLALNPVLGTLMCDLNKPRAHAHRDVRSVHSETFVPFN